MITENFGIMSVRVLQNPTYVLLEQLWGSLTHHQEAWLPMQEFGEKGKGYLFKSYTDLE